MGKNLQQTDFKIMLESLGEREGRSIQEKINSSSGGFLFQYSMVKLFKGNLTQAVMIKQQKPPFLIIIAQCDTSL